MVQFAGSYKIVSFEGTDGDLSKFIPESTTVEVKHEGNRYTFTQGDDVSVYEEGAETTNKFFWFPVKQPESSAWLRALPSSSLGNLLDDTSFRISVALRLGQSVCEPHICTCNETVNSNGLHGLSCNGSGCRLVRHSMINDIIKRALITAGIPAVLEPPGICRSDGRRVDGMTLVPWMSGKALLWDATCRDTMADSYINKISSNPGEAAKMGEIQKHAKYKDLEDRFCFYAFSVETFDSWGDEAKRLIRETSTRINNARSLSFITQRISLAIQHGNVASIIGTIPADIGLDEIFYL